MTDAEFITFGSESDFGVEGECRFAGPRREALLFSYNVAQAGWDFKRQFDHSTSPAILIPRRLADQFLDPVFFNRIYVALARLQQLLQLGSCGLRVAFQKVLANEIPPAVPLIHFSGFFIHFKNDPVDITRQNGSRELGGPIQSTQSTLL